MINRIVNIIRSLNAGDVIPFQEDKTTKINLYSNEVELYVDSLGEEKKFYYFAEFKLDNEKNDNLDQIENIVMNNDAFAIIGDPSPSDSYMILLWKVEAIDESLYPRIINIEENEFFYKKYIFYYTENELECFLNWYMKLEESDKATLTKTLQALQTLSDESEEMKFLTRLLIKVPFLNPVFPKAVMNDFTQSVEQKIGGIRQKSQKENVEIVNDMIMQSMDQGNFDIEMLSTRIYKRLMEE